MLLRQVDACGHPISFLSPKQLFTDLNLCESSLYIHLFLDKFPQLGSINAYASTEVPMGNLTVNFIVRCTFGFCFNQMFRYLGDLEL